MVFRQKHLKPPNQVKPSFLGSADVLSYFLTRTSSRRKSANPSTMPMAFLLGSGDKHKKQRTIILRQLKQSTIKIFIFCKRQKLQYYSYSVLIGCYKILISYVFYVYRPMSVCKRNEVTLCVMADVDDRELALYRTHQT